MSGCSRPKRSIEQQVQFTATPRDEVNIGQLQRALNESDSRCFHLTRDRFCNGETGRKEFLRRCPRASRQQRRATHLMQHAAGRPLNNMS